MAVLDKYYRQIDTIDKGLEQEAYKILVEAEEIITALNTGQLYEGKTPKGQKLTPKYSRVRYARAKNELNPLPGFGTPDLKVTGDFYSEFYLTAKNQEFELHSSDFKTGFLEKKYGKENIFGLTVQNNKIVNYEIVLPRLMEWVLSKIKI